MFPPIAFRAQSGRRTFRRIAAAAAQIGVLPGDSDEMRLRKATVVLSSVLFILAGAIWGVVYIMFDRPLAGAIPLGYAIFSSFNFAIFARTRRYNRFRFSQLFLVLLLPFLLMLVLGGYVSGSAVIMWGFASPLGALLFADLRQAHRWYLAFFALLVLAGLIASNGPFASGFSEGLINLFFVANIGGLSAVTFLIVRYFVQQKNMALELLAQEREKSERLLLNVLPAEIAARLKGASEAVIADAYEAVSVLFADIVGFTPLSASLPPEEMVRLLNEVFRHFDELAAKYGVEKIRTMGDNYMVAAGVPRARDDHAQALARLALDMNSYLATLPVEGGRPLQFRIGINSGPVIAGVIGQTKFHYDIWGDTVNTASRMESHGLPGKIHITEETMELLKDEFICRPRGLIEVKGKGQMETYFLEAPISNP